MVDVPERHFWRIGLEMEDWRARCLEDVVVGLEKWLLALIKKSSAS